MSADELSSSSESGTIESLDDLPRRRSRPNPHEDFRRASQILDDQLDQETWSEFLRQADEDTFRRTAHSRSSDRKRRLTSSSEGPNIRRTGSGAFRGSGSTSANQSTARLPPTPPRPSALTSHRDSSISQPIIYDLTQETSSPRSSPAPQPPPRPNVGMEGRRISSSHSTPGEYTVPKWQPDAEVTHCPICKSQFTFWYRKHHCRKCGRVVCATCSPHRITIPRQFIVHPPEHRRTSQQTNLATIDLTEDDPTDTPQESNMVSSRQSNPALGGGEAVRLCKPCVPDPQPPPSASSPLPHQRSVAHWTNGVALDEYFNPIPGLRNSGATEFFDGRPWGNDWRSSTTSRPNPSSFSGRRPSVTGSGIPTPSWASEQARDFRRQRGRGMIFQDENSNLNAVHTGAEEIPEEGLPRYGTFDYTVVPSYGRRGLPPGYTPRGPTNAPPDYRAPSGSAPTQASTWRNSLPDPRALSNALPSLRRPSQPPAVSSYRGRAPSDLPPRPPPPPPPNRPRVRSMLEPSTITSPSSSAHRPRLTERDLCPICQRILPPLGPNNSEADRERHIIDCITLRETASSSPISRNRAPSSASNHAPHGRPSISFPPPTPAPHMLPFKATEKDCVGQDGGVKECSICMVEYDVGDSLARLECLCCFHEGCIRSWFERKMECPVHKVA